MIALVYKNANYEKYELIARNENNFFFFVFNYKLLKTMILLVESLL